MNAPPTRPPRATLALAVALLAPMAAAQSPGAQEAAPEPEPPAAATPYGPGYGPGPGFGPRRGMGLPMGPWPGMMGPGGGHGPGRMGGYGMGPGMMPGMGPGGGLGRLWMLDLDEEQRRRLGEIQRELRTQHIDLMRRMSEEQAKLVELYAAERRDPTAIGQSYDRMFDLQRRMIESGLEAANQGEDMLSEEQRQRLKDMRGGGRRWGRGPGGPGQ